jgi:hypothetical protein
MEKSHVDTGNLEATPGHTGNQLGAQVIRSETNGDEQTVEIEVPIDPDRVDQVEVISTSGDSVVLTRPARIRQNYENDNVGISVKVPKTENLGFRLRLIDNTENDWPPVRHQ